MRNFFPLILFLFSSQAFAQISSSSPYSASGIGEEGSMMEAQFAGLGNIKGLMMDSNVVNFYNPSTYSYLATGQPLMSIGLGSRISNFSQGDLSTRQTVAGINHLAFVVPVRKSFGLAFGTNTFSRKGYTLVSQEPVYDDSVQHTYAGTGSIQRVFVGLSYKIINTKANQLSAGANLGYLFGTVANQRYALFQSLANSGGIDETKLRLKSAYFDFGVSYKGRIERNGVHQILASAIFAPQQELKASQEYALYYSASDIMNRNTYDTLQYSTGNKGTISYPNNISVGLGYTYSPDNKETNRKHIYQLGVFTEYNRTSWADYKETFNDHSSPHYINGQRMSIGFQYIPSINFVSKTEGNGLLSRVRYRAGYYYQTLPVLSSGLQVRENAATLGFGIPMASTKNNSFLNVSVVAGTRNNGTTTGINEKFLCVSLGVIIGPSFSDRWFRKYKLD